MPARQFWRTGVADPGPFGLEDLHRPRFGLSPRDRIMTVGSCFAQNISKALRREGFNWLVTEPAPPGLSAQSARRFGYDVFTARTGNVYTSASMKQWVERALCDTDFDDEIWREANGRFRDPLRPTVEPDGFASEAELRTARTRTFSALRTAFAEADVLILTLGLTEAWRHRDTGLLYQMCPGVQGGEFDGELHRHVNFRFDEVMADLEAVIHRLQTFNPTLRTILTISPQPLTATAEDMNALVANAYTKSVLRAVAGEAAVRHERVDYFPSYELLASPSMRGMFYAPNMRTVEPAGVDFVMSHFFRAYCGGETAWRGALQAGAERDEAECNEMILDFYNAN